MAGTLKVNSIELYSGSLLTVTPNTSFSGTLAVSGATTLSGELTVGGGYGATGVTISAAGNIQANGTLTIDGVSTFAAGSAATPAITTTGDANTGILFPAADTVAITTGGTERVRVDSSGNVGIAYTPHAWGSNRHAIELSGSSTGYFTCADGPVAIGTNVYYDSADKYVGNGYANLYSMSNGGHSWLNASNNAGGAGVAITWTTVMSLTSGGALLLGPGTAASGGGEYLNVTGSNTGYNVRFYNSHGSNPYGMLISYSACAPSNTGNQFFQCVDNAAERLTIRSNGGIANYQTNDVNLSDLAVKQDFTPFDPDKTWNFGLRMFDAWGRFKYVDQTHDDWNNGYGAQLVEVAAGEDFPELVSEESWGKDDEGNPIMRKEVYDSDLMHIMGYIVTLSQKKIDALETKVTQLEQQLSA